MKLFVLGALIVGVVGSVAFTQGPGGGGGKKGGGWDPDSQFDRLTNGGDAIVVSEYQTDERMAKIMPTETVREWMTAFMQEKGIKNGKLTREQYREYSEWVTPRRNEHFQKMRDSGAFGGGGKQSDGGKKGGESSQVSDDVEARAQKTFEWLDKDKDGFLNTEEMQAGTRMRHTIYEERATYDTNSDGKIDFKEFLVYYKARDAKRGDGKDKDKRSKGDPNAWTQEEDKPKGIPEEKRVVYRVGSLPKDLPTWYVELDKDKDGQIGLYEWKAAGKDLKEFMAMDANGDGFVTVEEIFRFQKAAAAKKSDEARLSGLMPMQMIIAPGAGSSGNAKGKDQKGEYKNKYGGGGGDPRKMKGKGNYGPPNR